MSTRTHAPECAKTRAVHLCERNNTGDEAAFARTKTAPDWVAAVECTCDAEYQPSVEERLRHAEHDRETLEKLENMFEAVVADLVEAVESMRDAQREMCKASRG